MRAPQGPQPSALSLMAGQLLGQSVCATGAEASSAAVMRAVQILRASGDALVQQVADALERGAVDMADINRELGLKRRRGGAHDSPRAKAKRGMVEVELVALAETTGEPNATRAARRVKDLIEAKAPGTFMIRTMAGVPRSVEGIARVLRSVIKA